MRSTPVCPLINLRNNYLDFVRQTVRHLPFEDQHRALKAAAKRVARHSGSLSRYDGQGRLVRARPQPVKLTGRVPYPVIVATTADDRREAVAAGRAERAEARRQTRVAKGQFGAPTGRGPSRYRFVLTDAKGQPLEPHQAAGSESRFPRARTP